MPTQARASLSVVVTKRAVVSRILADGCGGHEPGRDQRVDERTNVGACALGCDVERGDECGRVQPAVERPPKALLIARGTDPPKIHDLTRLARMLDESIQARLDTLGLIELTRWAIEGRYPGDVEEASAQDASVALDAARAVVDTATALLNIDDYPRS